MLTNNVQPTRLSHAAYRHRAAECLIVQSPPPHHPFSLYYRWSAVEQSERRTYVPIVEQTVR